MKKLIFDQTVFSQAQALLPFALTDVFTEQVSQQPQEIMHFWQLHDILILGMKDTRVNDLNAGLASLAKTPYTPIVRNSGGLGVIADDGILNISLIVPKTASIQTIDEAYQFIFQLTQKAFHELTIEAFEVSDSYCPGTFDLSVNGQKIAGTAQRRLKDGVAVMMYLSVNGDQQQRGEVVRHFYETSLGSDFGTNGYPAVRPASMTTLADVLGKDITVDEVKQRFMALWHTTTIHDYQTWLKENELTERFANKLTNMIQRNEQLTKGV